MKQRPDLRHPAIRALHLAVLQEWRWQMVALFLLLGAGAALVCVFFRQNAILTAIGLLCLLAAIRSMRQLAGNHRVENTRLFQLLCRRPGEIVWIYSVVTQRMPFGLEFTRHGILYFRLLDGDQISISLPESQLRLVTHYLRRCLPHATFGYSRDREQWYLASPHLLLREEPGAGK